MSDVRDLELVHYPKRGDFTLDRTRTYSGGGGAHKPAGFWVSVPGADGWLDWCYGNGWSDPEGMKKREHRVTIADSANVLLLDTEESVMEFGENLTAHGKTFPGSYANRPYVDHEAWDKAVKPHYDGVIIVPFQNRLRWNMDWYYSWDCASGVIWNVNVIESVTPVREVSNA